MDSTPNVESNALTRMYSSPCACSALGELGHDPGGVVQVEHGVAPHVPVGVARVRVVGVLDRDRPLVVEAVLELSADLVVGQVGQEGEGSLCDAHGGSSLRVG